MLGSALDSDVITALEDQSSASYALARESDLIALMVVIGLVLIVVALFYAVAAYNEARKTRQIAESTHALLREALRQSSAPGTFAQGATRFLESRKSANVS